MRKHIAMRGQNKGQLVRCVAIGQCILGGDSANHIDGTESPSEMADKVIRLADQQGVDSDNIANIKPYQNDSDNEKFVLEVMNKMGDNTNIIKKNKNSELDSQKKTSNIVSLNDLLITQEEYKMRSNIDNMFNINDDLKRVGENQSHGNYDLLTKNKRDFVKKSEETLEIMKKSKLYSELEVKDRESRIYSEKIEIAMREVKSFMKDEYYYPEDRFFHSPEKRKENQEMREMSEEGKKFYQEKFRDIVDKEAPEWIRKSDKFSEIQREYNQALNEYVSNSDFKF